MKLGILGGSFNPVHNGHLFIAEKALINLKLDRVVMIPAYRSPFKLEDYMETGANDRLEMLAAAIAGDARFAIDDCEIRREGVSYTIHTLEDIINRYLPEEKPYLIIGDDLAKDFPKWRDSERILQLAEIVIVRRIKDAVKKYPFKYTLIDCEVMDVSSRNVRHMIGGGSGWESLVPVAVRSIIEDKRLYGCSIKSQTDKVSKDPVSKKFSDSEDGLKAAILQVEAAARETLTMTRFLHSRNTALLAQDICRRFGLNPLEGYLAGIAHDLGKQLDVKQMLKLAKSDGTAISALEKDRPNLLHGRAAAVLLRERFCIHNKDILEAVAFHTSGKENMGELAKVIYIADKAEVSRNIDPALRKMCYEDTLDNILLAVLKKTVIKLQSKDLELSEDTLKLLETFNGSFNKRVKERNN